MNKENLKTSIDALFSSISLKMKEEARGDPLFTYLKSKSKWFENPEHLSSQVLHKVDKIIDLIVDEKYQKDDWLIHDIYRSWDFYDSNVTELCVKFYSSACSADRGRFIVKSAIKWRLSGELPVFNHENYWCPKTGTPGQWMDLIDGLGHLKHGSPEKYFFAYKALIENYNLTKERHENKPE